MKEGKGSKGSRGSRMNINIIAKKSDYSKRRENNTVDKVVID
jgi:hypothetical protein